MRNLFISMLLAGMSFIACNMHAVCVYNAENHVIRVYDYPESLPAGPRQLLFADQVNDWGLVTYDPASQTYTVNANLWIGWDDDSDTFFQLGTPERPREKLLLNGNLVIHPARHARRVNRLRIGCPDNPEVQTQLLFNCGPGKTYSLHAGAYYQGRSMTPGILTDGELQVYNGLISAADPQYPIGRHLYLYLDRIILKNAKIARVARTIGYGMNAKNSLIEDSVFEYGGNAFEWGTQKMRGVTFRHLSTAFGDSARYPLSATLTECRFENNAINWALIAGNIYLIDCDIGPPRKGNRYAARGEAKFTVQTGARRATVSAVDAPESIRAISSRHVRFNVIDKQGRQVQNAKIKAHCLQDNRIMRRATTGTDGMTPGRGKSGALLLDEWEESAGEIENEPVRREFSYAITVTPRRGDPVTVYTEFYPTQSWQVVTVNLEE